MRLLKRLFGLVRRKGRRQVRLRILLKTPDGEEKEYFTEDLSESGFRMAVPVSAITGVAQGDLELELVLTEGDVPAQVAARPVWTKRMPDGTEQSGWMFARYVAQAQERISAFLKALGRVS